MELQQIARSSLSSLSGQVAGHEAGIQTIANGSLVIKSCKLAEAQFYSQFLASSSSPIQHLKRYLPTYHGIVSFIDDNINEKEKDDESAIILENLTRPFVRPNILDIKLGQQLWDQESSEEKKKRMEEASQNSTSGTEGVRLTGWQVWDNSSCKPVSMSKKFGKTIKAPQLASGIRMFMGQPQGEDEEEASKVIGEKVVAPRLHKDLTRMVIEKGILPALDDMLALASQIEWRVRGGSVLIIYEGDEKTLQKGIGSTSALLEPGRRENQFDSQLDLNNGESIQSHSDKASEKRLVDVRLIDFAHTTFKAGEGPDQGYLLGLRKSRDLFARLLATAS